MKALLKNTQAYRLLKKENEENTCSHAYLLVYNDTKNLRFALKEFAKILFSCDEADGYDRDDEEKVRIAKLIDEDSYSDCLLFPAADKKLAVEDAETIKEESLLSPIEGTRKVFLIGDFAEANTQTQNKLLKLLEEPPAGVIFLLGTTTVFPVLSTVLSRTKKMEILPFSVDDVKTCLSRIYGNKYDNATLELCAAASGGIIGEAQNVLEGEAYKILIESAFSLCLCEESKLAIAVKNIGETKQKKELLSLLRLIFRDSLLCKLEKDAFESKILLRSEKEKIKKIAGMYSLTALLYAQEAISEAEKQVRFNAVFPQCIELCIAKIRKK